VTDVHWVLLFEVSEPVRKNRSRHCTLRGNPTYLYIQTANPGWGPAFSRRLRGSETLACPEKAASKAACRQNCLPHKIGKTSAALAAKLIQSLVPNLMKRFSTSLVSVGLESTCELLQYGLQQGKQRRSKQGAGVYGEPVSARLRHKKDSIQK